MCPRSYAALVLLMVAGVVHAQEVSAVASSEEPNDTKVVKPAPITGGLIGYEWSASHAKSALAGAIVPTQGGALVAIAGRI